MMLSDNLSYKEVIYSNTAIAREIPNEPTIEHLENLKAIAKNVFQPLRDHFGVPIKVTSGYRSKELNDAIGGSSTSQHSFGQALDLDADAFGGITNAQIFAFIDERLVFDQMIWEFGDNKNPDWVHVSYKTDGKNRGEKLIAYKKDGKTKYKLHG